ncbi:hypothetical protein QZM91_11420 [Burkholderia multivorans]|uniref:hypothetical protein n=1 Tax=Burkholderia multivorans TaxID=87883 RepID=UPI0026564AEB|nr:hypothetical protein [Burkholderia multivorans]MDN7968159.1 hypothetical protein [Burkholderia multivorans]MEB2487532.1 hypothetical protein [Burkholderia multivorans]MEB2569626.1 hypothetical protein [Burkholderia multivorans]
MPILFPSIAGLFVPELRALTRADLNALLERVRRDSLHRYNVAFVISWLGGMAGALLLGLLLGAGVAFVAGRCLPASWAPSIMAGIVGALMHPLTSAIGTALMTIRLKAEINAQLARGDVAREDGRLPE